MRHRKIKYIAAAGLIILASLFQTAATAAQPQESPTGAQNTARQINFAVGTAPGATVESKEEVIYGRLTASGAVDSLYVVNHFVVSAPGALSDHGDYSTAVNLTSTAAISTGNGTVSLDADAGDLYYQGTPKSKALPWHFEITYFMDGKEMQPAELAGESGALQIRIRTAQNTQIDPFFYENYMLQISVSLPAGKVSQLHATGAAVAAAGKNKLAAFTILPGENGDIALSAKVHSFEMPAIEISALPFEMPFDLPDASGFGDSLRPLSNAFSGVNQGVSMIASGMRDTEAGSMELASGSAAFQEGLQAVSSGGKELADASGQLNTSLQGLAAMSANLEMMAQQAESMGDVVTAAQIRGMILGLTNLSSSYGQFHSGLTAYTEGVSGLSLAYGELQGGTKALSDGLSRLSRGSAEIASGADTLAGQTNDLPDRLTSETETLMGAYNNDDFKPRSFFSEKNGSISLVQFVLRTDAIALPEVSPADETEPEPDTFWTRLMALFR